MNDNTTNLKSSLNLRTLKYFPLEYYQKQISNAFPQQQILFNPLENPSNMKFVFSHSIEDNTNSIFSAIKTSIEKAIEVKSFILVCSFYITCNEVLKLLIKATKVLPGKVYVLVGEQDDLSLAISKRMEILPNGLKKLSQMGALIRKKSGAHLKFLVTKDISIIMTSNLSPEGLFRNPEYGLVYYQNESVSEGLKQIFTTLWHEKSEHLLVNGLWVQAPNWDSPHSSHQLNFSKPSVIISSQTIQKYINKNSNPKKIHPKTLYEKIIEQLKSATKSIDISVYSFQKDKKEKKINEIIKILGDKAKDMPVRLIVPEVKTRLTRDMKNTLDDLQSFGITIKYYKELHGKIIIIDKKRAFLFTGNFDKYLTSDTTFDIGVIINNKLINANILKYFNHIWEESSTELGISAPLNVKLDLVVNSGEKYVALFQKLFKTSYKMEWLQSDGQIKLKIYTQNPKPNIFTFETRDCDFYGDQLSLQGLLKKLKFSDKDADIFTVNHLELCLLWQNEINKIK